MSSIHPTAIIDSAARIGDGAKIGPFCVVGPDVELGANVDLISHVCVAGRTKIGAGAGFSKKRGLWVRKITQKASFCSFRVL